MVALPSYIQRTPQGRIITELGYRRLGLSGLGARQSRWL
jgi:Holliday junction resolvasome RuvABC ATP-dependent DNA helicase subunit